MRVPPGCAAKGDECSALSTSLTTDWGTSTCWVPSRCPWRHNNPSAFSLKSVGLRVSSNFLTPWQNPSAACFWANSPRGMRAVPPFSGLWGSSTAPDRVVTPTVGISWEMGPSSNPSVAIRGCHGYIPEDYIRALYPYPLRIRAEDAYPKFNTRKGGEDISILSDKNCEIISDPYPRYESQDRGIYIVMRRPAPGEFWLNEVDLSARVPTIGGLMSEHLAATSGDPARPGWNRSITRLDPIALLSECDTRFRTVILTSVYTNGGEPPRRRPLGR